MGTVRVPFIAQATAVREIEVEVPDGLSDEDMTKAAQEKAEEAMAANEDLYNQEGAWKVNAVEGKTIILDPGERVRMPGPDTVDIGSLVPEV